ncbi:MAG: hypothetical protein IJB10_05550 [Clostridia bacterium]|nr:hypothetical protein [Clostridia bacterium]
MAKTVSTTSKDVLEYHLLTLGHAGRMSEAQFQNFFGSDWKPDELPILVAEYNRSVLTGNYSNFFRVLGQANEAYDLRKDTSFDQVLKEQNIELPGIIKDKDHSTSARKARGLEGMTTLIKKGKLSPDATISLLCSASYTERLLSKTEPHRTYLGRVQKSVVKGAFIEQDQKGTMKIDPKIEAFLESKLGFDKASTIDPATGKTPEGKVGIPASSILRTINGKIARTPIIEGRTEKYHYNQNSGNDLNYDNVGLRAVEEAANQTLSAVLLPSVKALISGETTSLFNSRNLSKEDTATLESLVCLQPKDTLESVSGRVSGFVEALKSLNIAQDTPITDSPELLEGLLQACVVTGAFAATTKDEFLYRAAEAATLPEFTSPYYTAGLHTAPGFVSDSTKAPGLLFVDGNIHLIDKIPARISTNEEGVVTVESRVDESNITEICQPLKEASEITSLENILPGNIAPANAVAMQLQAMHLEEAEKRVAGFDAESASGNLTSGARKMDSDFSLGLFRSTAHFQARKQATMAKIEKYCGYLFQDMASPFADASKDVVVQAEAVETATEGVTPGLDVSAKLTKGGEENALSSDSSSQVAVEGQQPSVGTVKIEQNTVVDYTGDYVPE